MTPAHCVQTIRCRGKTLLLGSRVLIMGVLNVTPDSFSDGGHYTDPVAALDRVQQMIFEGADLIDIGGESTRPGALYVSENEEIRRITPLLSLLGKHINIPLSIDTRKAGVAQTALDLGADIINDVSALQDDPRMASLIQKSEAGVVLMHRQGHSLDMQQSPHYEDIVGEVKTFLTERVSTAVSVGIQPDQIMVDPGIGFGKTSGHNLKILANVGAFLELGQPVLLGFSRKGFIGELTGKPADKREMGNAAALASAIWQGAHIFRVHDVGAMTDVVRVAQALRNSCDKY